MTEKQDVTYSSALVRGQSPITSIYTALGQLFCHGWNVIFENANFAGKDSKYRAQLLHCLPQYHFNHSKRYWEESRISRRLRLSPEQRLDLLGKPTADWNPLDAKWRTFIRVSEMPWVKDHQVS
jgi:hypothetical protein